MLNTAALLALCAALVAPASAANPQRAQQLAVDAAASGLPASTLARTDMAHRRLRFRVDARKEYLADYDYPDYYDYDVLDANKKVPEKTPEEPADEEEDIEGLVECTTQTVETEVTVEKNAEIHAEAITEAFAMACQKGSDVNVKMLEDIFLQEDAFAFAHATAVAMISCESTDEDAYHCASVTASATAFAEATAEAHASAVSKAVASCGCMTDAVSVSVASSEIYINLIAEATATATASVCIEGTGMVSATAYDSCTSLVFGKVFARAVAEAIVKGDCMNSEAIARVLTEAGADFDSFSTCGMTAAAIKVA